MIVIVPKVSFFFSFRKFCIFPRGELIIRIFNLGSNLVRNFPKLHAKMKEMRWGQKMSERENIIDHVVRQVQMCRDTHDIYRCIVYGRLCIFDVHCEDNHFMTRHNNPLKKIIESIQSLR